MERPARVRIRRRKPWTLARRRLFGGKVRLLTVISPGLKTAGLLVAPASDEQHGPARKLARPQRRPSPGQLRNARVHIGLARTGPAGTDPVEPMRSVVADKKISSTTSTPIVVQTACVSPAPYGSAPRVETRVASGQTRRQPGTRRHADRGACVGQSPCGNGR